MASFISTAGQPDLLVPDRKTGLLGGLLYLVIHVSP
jgi:hypothetical protein